MFFCGDRALVNMLLIVLHLVPPFTMIIKSSWIVLTRPTYIAISRRHGCKYAHTTNDVVEMVI